MMDKYEKHNEQVKQSGHAMPFSITRRMYDLFEENDMLPSICHYYIDVPLTTMVHYPGGYGPLRHGPIGRFHGHKKYKFKLKKR